MTYRLHIYHIGERLKKSTEDDQTCTVASIGHFFVSLQKDNKMEYFREYHPECFVDTATLYYTQKDKTGSEELELLEEIKIKRFVCISEEHLTTKTFVLDQHQYQKALDFAKNKLINEKSEFSDCIDFVQAIYNAAGLLLYFTIAYSTDELVKLKSLFALKLLKRYGSRDNMPQQFHCISAFNTEDLSYKLNVEISRIVRVPIFWNWDLPRQRIGDYFGSLFHVDIDENFLKMTEKFIENN